METRFSSKIDGWLIPVMIVAVGGLVVALIAVLVEETPWPIRVLVGVVTVIVTMLLFAVFRNTCYVIAGDTLRIRSGPFKWTIPWPISWKLRPAAIRCRRRRSPLIA